VVLRGGRHRIQAQKKNQKKKKQGLKEEKTTPQLVRKFLGEAADLTLGGRWTTQLANQEKKASERTKSRDREVGWKSQTKMVKKLGAMGKRCTERRGKK